METLGYSSGTTAKLAIESKRMEDRLRMLKQMMSAEKSRRETEGGLHWQSGAHEKKVVKPQRKSNKKPLQVKLLTTDSSSLSSIKLPQCGQCDKSTATLHCVECIEKYCQLCFAKFHQKGALSQHHVKPVLNKKTVQSHEVKSKLVERSLSSTDASSHVSQTSTGQSTVEQADSVVECVSLLEGTYNEEESAASFQQALAEWRASKTTTTNNNSNISISSANISAATQTATVGNTRQKLNTGVQFSNKNGLSYFEKLVMRRHRYDPLYLVKSATNDNSTNNIAPTATNDDSFNANDGDSSETTPSTYNIFYCMDEDEPQSHSDEQNQYGVMAELCSPKSNVEISEEIYSQDSTQTGARPEAVKIQLSDIKHITDTVTEGCSKDTTSELSVQPANKQIRNAKRKSAGKQRGHSANMSFHSGSGKQKSPGTSIKCKETVSNIKAAVKSAWSDSCKQTQLSDFFLQGVDPSSQSSEVGHLKSVEEDNNCGFQLAASVWLPGNSTVQDPGADSTSAGINCYTDLPSNADTLAHSSDSEATDINQQPTRGTLLCDLEDQQEWDHEDQETLECLAWELASTVEYEGRLTRCESELDDSIEYGMGTPLFVNDSSNEDNTEQVIKDVDIHQVMSDFELYQKQVMEYDSN